MNVLSQQAAPSTTPTQASRANVEPAASPQQAAPVNGDSGTALPDSHPAATALETPPRRSCLRKVSFVEQPIIMGPTAAKAKTTAVNHTPANANTKSDSNSGQGFVSFFGCDFEQAVERAGGIPPSVRPTHQAVPAKAPSLQRTFTGKASVPRPAQVSPKALSPQQAVSPPKAPSPQQVRVPPKAPSPQGGANPPRPPAASRTAPPACNQGEELAQLVANAPPLPSEMNDQKERSANFMQMRRLDTSW